MSRICIPYATSEGQTERIAEYIADLVRHHGHEAEPMDIRESADVDLGGYDGIIVGSPVLSVGRAGRELLPDTDPWGSAGGFRPSSVPVPASTGPVRWGSGCFPAWPSIHPLEWSETA